MSSIGSSDDPLKITFVVSLRQDPELYKWLKRHPFKNTSTAVRVLLNIGAAAISALDSAKREYDGAERRRDDVPDKKPKTVPVKALNGSGTGKKVDQAKVIGPNSAPKAPSEVSYSKGTATASPAKQTPAEPIQSSDLLSSASASSSDEQSNVVLDSDMKAAMDAIAMLDKRF